MTLELHSTDFVADAPEIYRAAGAILGLSGTGTGGGTPVPPANTGTTVGTGPDKIEIIVANMNNGNNVFRVKMDGVQVTGDLTCTTGDVRAAGGQLFTIFGAWGPAPHRITYSPQASGLGGAWINAVYYNGNRKVFNGLDPSSSHPGTFVNALNVWDGSNQDVTFADPIAVVGGGGSGGTTPPPFTIIAATVDGVARSDTLDNLAKAANTAIALPAGTFIGSALLTKALAVTGAGVGKTILDGTGIRLAFDKAGLVPNTIGSLISGITFQHFAVGASLGGNGCAVRAGSPGLGFAMVDCEVTGCENGIQTDGNVTFTRVNCHGNGVGALGGGLTHEWYLNGTTTDSATLIDCIGDCGPMATHGLKTRHGKTTVTGGHYQSNPTSANIQGHVIDIPDGGLFDGSGVTVVVPAGSSDTGFLLYGADSNKNAAAGNAVNLRNCVFEGHVGNEWIDSKIGGTLDVTGATYTGTKPLMRGWTLPIIGEATMTQKVG